MRIYYDTEFMNLDEMIDWDMISAGFVTEDGREWYVEVTDFDEDTCSDFVRATVLPLLRKGNKLPERMPSTHFAWRLCHWLETLNEPLIELVSDSACDWSIVTGYCYAEFRTFTIKVQGLNIRQRRSEKPWCTQSLSSGRRTRECSTTPFTMPAG